MNKHINIFILFMALAINSVGQVTKVTEAVNALQAGDLETARTLINEATVHVDTKDKSTTWYYRGFIYKEIYKLEKDNKESPARIVALDAFGKLITMPDIGELEASGKKSLKFLARTMYNDAAKALNIAEYHIAIKNYDRYKKEIIIIVPDKDFKALDTQFYLVLGGVYNEIFEVDKQKNGAFFNKAKEAYNQVMLLDSNNLSANYNLGILYYNEAVNIIKNLDYEVDIIKLELIQDECIELFRSSLPYMKKAYELNPQRQETLIGLSGIYFSLNEMQKSEKIQEELKLLKDGEE